MHMHPQGMSHIQGTQLPLFLADFTSVDNTATGGYSLGIELKEKLQPSTECHSMVRHLA